MLKATSRWVKLNSSKEEANVTDYCKGGDGCLCMVSILHYVPKEHPQPTLAIRFIYYSGFT